MLIDTFRLSASLFVALGLAGATECCNLSNAAAESASAQSLHSLLATAHDGDVIKLKPGFYSAVTFPAKSWSPAIVIDATDAVFTGLVFRGTGGVTIRGGYVQGPGGRSYGISIRDSARVRIESMRISGAHRGIVLQDSRDVALIGNELTGLISDGIDIALSQGVTVKSNTCRNFSPIPAVYDAAGKRLRDGDHPDCIQAWSRPTGRPTADLTIQDNQIEGSMQGIYLGNVVRDGVNDGGFDRVTITGNKIRVSYPQGLSVYGGRGVTVKRNLVETVPGARLPNHPERPVRASLRIVDSIGVEACGNHVAEQPGAPGQGPCASDASQ